MIGNGQSGKASSSQSEAFTRVLLLAHAAASRDKILHLHLAAMPLKRKPLAMGKRAPRAPSIVGWFCRLPSPASVVGSVAPPICPLARAAAQAPPAAIGGDEQSDNTPATTRDGPAGMEIAVLWPRCVEREQLFHDGRSD